MESRLASGSWWRGSEKAGDRRPTGNKQGCTSDQQTGSEIGGASYVRRPGRVGLKTGRSIETTVCLQSILEADFTAPANDKPRYSPLSHPSRRKIFTLEKLKQKSSRLGHTGPHQRATLSHHTTNRRGIEGRQILQRLYVKWWDPRFLPLTASQNAYSLTCTLQAGDQRVFLNRTQLARERSPNHMAWSGVPHREAQQPTRFSTCPPTHTHRASNQLPAPWS